MSRQCETKPSWHDGEAHPNGTLSQNKSRAKRTTVKASSDHTQPMIRQSLPAVVRRRALWARRLGRPEELQQPPDPRCFGATDHQHDSCVRGQNGKLQTARDEIQHSAHHPTVKKHVSPASITTTTPFSTKCTKCSLFQEINVAWFAPPPLTLSPPWQRISQKVPTRPFASRPQLSKYFDGNGAAPPTCLCIFDQATNRQSVTVSASSSRMLASKLLVV